MQFLRILLLYLILIIFAASCKSKKPVVISHPVKQTTETPEKHVTKETETTPQKEKLKFETKNIADKTLTNFIEDWYGVTYKYGGSDKHGIDCSHFTARLYADVYNKKISGAASVIEPLTTTIKLSEMHEGDLVFFKIEQNKVSHVGVYIGNNKFVHASTSKGVIISSLDEAYYKKYFYKAGKLK